MFERDEGRHKGENISWLDTKQRRNTIKAVLRRKKKKNQTEILHPLLGESQFSFKRKGSYLLDGACTRNNCTQCRQQLN